MHTSNPLAVAKAREARINRENTGTRLAYTSESK